MEVKSSTRQKITPFLWFNNNAEEAISFYTSVFKNSEVKMMSRYGAGAPMPEGTFFTGTFQLEGQDFMAINGGPHYSFTPAVSLFVFCDDQEEIDRLWEKLSEGGRKDRCGWLQDKFGLSWQIVPRQLEQLMHGPNKEGAGRVMQALMKMDKINIAQLQQAYDEPVTA